MPHRDGGREYSEELEGQADSSLGGNRLCGELGRHYRDDDRNRGERDEGQLETFSNLPRAKYICMYYILTLVLKVLLFPRLSRCLVSSTKQCMMSKCQKGTGHIFHKA